MLATFQKQIKLPPLFVILVKGRSCVTYQRAYGSDLNLDPLGPSPESFKLYMGLPPVSDTGQIVVLHNVPKLNFC